jgi:glycine/D-amino acid oxidase-like deaminating enzyme
MLAANSMKRQIAIIGQGYAGLSFAIALASKLKNIQVAVLSKEPAKDPFMASNAAQGLSTIKGLLEADDELFSLKMMAHRQFLDWIHNVETWSQISIPKILGVGEKFLNHNTFKEEQGRIYKNQFTGAFRVEKISTSNVFYEQRYPGDFWVDPDIYLKALKEAAINLGVQFKETSGVQTVSSTAEKAYFSDSDTNYEADQLMLACGYGLKDILLKTENEKATQELAGLIAASGHTVRLTSESKKRLALVKKLHAFAQYDENIFLGSTTEINGKNLNDFKTLWDQNRIPHCTSEVAAHFNTILSHDFQIQNTQIQKENLQFGVRVRTRKRHPWTGFIDRNHRIYINTAYYKSGLVLCPFIALKESLKFLE